MNESRTRSILQRVPVILAVTAASYGLPMQAQDLRSNIVAGHALSGAATAPARDRGVRDTVAQRH